MGILTFVPVFGVVVFLFARGSSSANLVNDARQCAEDFSPCTCANLTHNISMVNCNGVPYSEIQSTFSASENAYFIELNIFPSAQDDGIPLPSNVLGGNKALFVNIYCVENPDFRLVVSPDAFNSSHSSLLQFKIQFCNLQSFDWFFLEGFQSVANIETFMSSQWSAATLPSLPSLKNLVINTCEGFSSWGDPSLEGLLKLEIPYDALDDTATHEIISSVSAHSSSLAELDIRNNNLTRIPELLNSFPRLDRCTLTGNNIAKIPRGAINFATSATYVDFSYNVISQIELGAFQGNFSATFVSLSGNKLTRLESDVFKPMLDDMIRGSGQLELYWNMFDCDCHIAWLIRDNRELLSVVTGGTCSDSTSFEDVDPSIFALCS